MRLVRTSLVSGVAALALTGAGAAHAMPASTQVVHKPVTSAVVRGTGTDGHGLGLDVRGLMASKARTGNTTRQVGAMMAPAVAATGGDLTQYTITAGNQANTNSCVAFAIGWNGYGLIMKQQGISGAPMAPMYIYAQLVRGYDHGTFGSAFLDMARQQGIDTRAHYSHGDYDYTSQPNASDRANAANYKLDGYRPIQAGQGAQQQIIDAVAAGQPVAVGMYVYQNFNDVDPTTAMNYSYQPAGGRLGGHEMLIVAADSRGVKLQNSWGTRFGSNGFITMSWNVLLRDVMDFNAIGRVQGGNPNPPAPTPTPQPVPTTTPAPNPFPTPQPVPTTTAPDPWPTPQPVPTTPMPVPTTTVSPAPVPTTTVSPAPVPTTTVNPGPVPTTVPPEPGPYPTPTPNPWGSWKDWWDWWTS